MTSQPSETRTVRNIYGVLRTVRSHGTYKYRSKLNYRHKWQVTHDVSAKMNEIASANWLLSSRRQCVDACRTSVLDLPKI